MSRRFQAAQIVRPIGVMVYTEVIEDFPRIETGVVAVVEAKFYGVSANRLNGRDVDILLADLQHGLSRAMSTDFG